MLVRARVPRNTSGATAVPAGHGSLVRPPRVVDGYARDRCTTSSGRYRHRGDRRHPERADRRADAGDRRRQRGGRHDAEPTMMPTTTTSSVSRFLSSMDSATPEDSMAPVLEDETDPLPAALGQLRLAAAHHP